MKAIKLFILMSVFFSLNANCQDSVRLRIDKPGTPASLKNLDKKPVNRNHMKNENRPPQQTIYHGATESNTINSSNLNEKLYPVKQNAADLPRTPKITVDDRDMSEVLRRDTTINNGRMGNGQSNVTNPIRND